MPHSADEQEQPDPLVPGQGLAVMAEALYITNLLLLPGLAFIALLVVYIRNIHIAPALTVCHLRQTLSASLWAGSLLHWVSGEQAITVASGRSRTPRTGKQVAEY